MSKRCIFPQQYGERKKAKLDITVSDHNFPLSQNVGTSKGGCDQASNWGDDNDDEILLLASQACEDAYNISTLPNYSMCMQPSSTSTQITESVPSTSKTGFPFKKPTHSPLSMVTTQLKNKYEKISSPLPGMSDVCKGDGVNVSDDIILNDNIYKGQDSDNFYRQLLKLQEENAKLKSENGKLLEKCVTKEGEASILRAQLKTCQVTVDNVRLEKVQAQERAQMEWCDKLATAQNKMQDLRNQLDFKNLEIISIKEKCKMLESNKVKLTQVMVTGNDISMSQKNTNSGYAGNETRSTQFKRTKITSKSVQTEGKLHFLKLNLPYRGDTSQLTRILPLVLEPASEHGSILDYNEKLKHRSIDNKCRVFSTFHRLPSTPTVTEQSGTKNINLMCVYGNLTNIAARRDADGKNVLEIFERTIECMRGVRDELQAVRRRATTAFHREMDEKYIHFSTILFVVQKEDLLRGRTIYKEEQGVLAKRMTAILVHVLDSSSCEGVSKILQEHLTEQTELLNIISEICTLLDATSCAVLYSGFLLSVAWLLKSLLNPANAEEIVAIVKKMILSRPMSFVSCELLVVLAALDALRGGRGGDALCCGAGAGALRVDYEQGVLLYNKDSCALLVLLKQLEAAPGAARRLAALCGGLDHRLADDGPDDRRCDSRVAAAQTTLGALRTCARILDDDPHGRATDALATCRGGVQALYRCVCRGAGARLGHAEGQLMELCDVLRRYEHPDIYTNMLSDITSTFQCTPEESPTSHHKQAWIDSFQTFSLAD